ncbi:hypothetical protein M408DRAFT_23756 [Serendipita vermifera MAFF 305830]|uniref:Uncharacterized protein n=1 Tax=Serendipita vermifera MAFF 305830 TaxID=933852 RepID=A0A0C3BA79_SERVB|nr:hypothetical protein M408DRAFT_23756 [Serendipita vermifera MAFF 305830]
MPIQVMAYRPNAPKAMLRASITDDREERISPRLVDTIMDMTESALQGPQPELDSIDDKPVEADAEARRAKLTAASMSRPELSKNSWANLLWARIDCNASTFIDTVWHRHGSCAVSSLVSTSGGSAPKQATGSLQILSRMYLMPSLKSMGVLEMPQLLIRTWLRTCETTYAKRLGW